MTRRVLLDKEAVVALSRTSHASHPRVLALMQVVAGRKARHQRIDIVVPTTVRVEAGWDRTAPSWALVNRLRIADAPLDADNANTAAAIRTRTGVSVTDAHLGAVVHGHAEDATTVVTSDPDDMRLVADPLRPRIVRI